MGGALVAGTCILLGNWHYGRIELSWSGLVLTPLNLIRYNADLSNLALHGLHPWYLHLTVNMLLLFGPLYPYWIVRNLIVGGMERLFFGPIVLLPLLGLSMKPHQEPRILLPLALPLILQVSRHLRSRLILSAWILFNSVTLIMFGVCIKRVLSRLSHTIHRRQLSPLLCSFTRPTCHHDICLPAGVKGPSPYQTR